MCGSKMNCPICKYSDEGRNFRLEAARIKRRMPKYMRDKIKRIVMLISDNAAPESLNYEDFYKLVYAIRYFGCQASEKAIDDYFYYGYHRQGKGLIYLIGMIRRSSEGIENQKRYESTLQAIPPTVKRQ